MKTIIALIGLCSTVAHGAEFMWKTALPAYAYSNDYLCFTATNNASRFIIEKTNIIIPTDYKGTIQVGTNFYYIQAQTQINYTIAPK